jgi:SAM-dependent methyltransferase
MPDLGQSLRRVMRDPRRLRAMPRNVRRRIENRRSSWTKAGDVKLREYTSYDAYVRHQGSKLDDRIDDVHVYDAQLEAALVDRLVRSDLEGRSVLCLAARLGGEVRAFRRLGAFAVGVDLNPGGASRYVLEGDFHQLDFPDACVDVVFTNSMDHALDPDKLLTEVRRVLRPGGAFILEAMDYGQNSPGPWEVMVWQSTASLRARIESVGFTTAETTSFDVPWPGSAMTFVAHSSLSGPATPSCCQC